MSVTTVKEKQIFVVASDKQFGRHISKPTFGFQEKKSQRPSGKEKSQTTTAKRGQQVK